jgi:hypothetical protein
MVVGLGEHAVRSGKGKRRRDDQDESGKLFAALNVALMVGHGFL